LDRGHGLGGALGRLDRGKPPNRTLDGGIMRALNQVGRLFDHVEDQIDQPPQALHGGTLDQPAT
jgi:hypothetical protein